MKARAYGCLGAWVLAGLALVPGRLMAEDAEAATRQFAAAVALQNQGVYDLAADEWSKFINTHKTDSRLDRAFHYLGVCYLHSDHLPQAQQSFETVRKTYPKSELTEPNLLYLGVVQYKQAKAGKAELYPAAAASLDELLKKYPKGRFLAHALLTRGDCAYHQGQKADAVGFYARALENSPDEKLAAETLYALGVARQELNQHDEAGKAYDEFLKKATDSPLRAEVILRRGETLFATKQFAAAAEWFASAGASANFAMADYAVLRQAIALAQAGKHDAAAELFAAFPTRYPKSEHLAAAFSACHGVVRDLLKQNKPADALKLLEKVLPAAGSSPQAAQLLMDQADAVAETPDRRKEAVPLYASLAARYPKEAVAAPALYMAAYLTLGQGDYEAALKHADAFLAAYAAHELAPDATYVAAESRLLLGRYAEAEALYGQLIQKNPQHTAADIWKVRRATALHLQRKFKEAVELLQPVVAQLKNPEAQAEAQYLIGSGLAEQGQPAGAAKALEAALAAQPKWRQADETLLILAQCYYREKNTAKAAESLRKLVSDFPQSKLLDKAHFRLAEYATAASNPKTAAEEYRTVAQQYAQSPLVPHALNGLGWALFDQGDFAGAETALDTLIEKHPGHKLVPRARYARGLARHQLGKFDAAVADLSAMIATPEATTADKSDARYVIGLCQLGLKKTAEAVATFRTLLTEDPKYSAADKVYYEMAWALKADGKEKEGTEVFAELAKQCPASPRVAECHFHVGEAAYRAADFRAAATAYAAAMEKAGKTDLGEKSTHKLGWSYFRLDDAANAQQTFRYQRTTWPQGPLAADAAFMEAECLFKQKKYQDALAAYALVKNPSSKDFEALTVLHSAQALGQLKNAGSDRKSADWEKVLTVLDRAVQDFSDSPYLPEMIYERGWALQNLGRFDQALGEYQQVLGKSKGEAAARAQFMIGEIQFQQKQHAEAIGSYYRVIYGGYGCPQWEADATYEAARCFEVLRKTEQAKKLYKELVQKHPQSDKTPLARQRIQALQ